MDPNFSKAQLNFARKKFYGKFYYTGDNFNLINVSINKILIYLLNLKIFLINAKKKIIRAQYIFLKKKQNETFKPVFKINVNDTLFKKHSDELKNKNFTYIENFLDKDYYKYILNNWPNINFFRHSTKITTFYSMGFLYSKIENKLLENNKNFFLNEELRKFYEEILSNDFKNFINRLISFENVPYSVRSILSTMAKKNSYLIPHIDGIIYKNNGKNTYNFIYFIDGYDENPSLSGATGIYRDNDFKEPLLIPHTLKNSLLIYNSSAEFFHGFKLMSVPKDIYRKTVNFQFFPESLVEKDFKKPSSRN